MKSTVSALHEEACLQAESLVYDGLINFSANNTVNVLCFSLLSRIERELCTRAFWVSFILCMGFCVYAMCMPSLWFKGIALFALPLIMWILGRTRTRLQKKGFERYSRKQGLSLSYSNESLTIVRKYNMKNLLKAHGADLMHIDLAYRTLSRHEQRKRISPMVLVAMVSALIGSSFIALIDAWKWLFFSEVNATEPIELKLLLVISTLLLFVEMIVLIDMFQKSIQIKEKNSYAIALETLDRLTWDVRVAANGK